MFFILFGVFMWGVGIFYIFIGVTNRLSWMGNFRTQRMIRWVVERYTRLYIAGLGVWLLFCGCVSMLIGASAL